MISRLCSEEAIAQKLCDCQAESQIRKKLCDEGTVEGCITIR